MRNIRCAGFSAAMMLGLLFNNYQLKAQNTDELRKQFPGEKAVLLNRTLEYNITIKSGQPNVESRETQQLAFLSNNAVAYMGGYSFSHSSFRKLISYQAYTRTPEDKKLKVSDFKTSTEKESSVFYDDYKTTSFNFPAVASGAVGNLEVAWQNTEPHLLSPYYFSGNIPVVNSSLKVTVAKNINIKYQLMGLDTSHIETTIESAHGNKVYTFTYKNCPADKRYPDAPSYAWYSPHVIFHIENYVSGGKQVSYLANVNDLYKLNYSFIKGINSTTGTDIKHVVDSLTTNVTSPEEKTRKIYNWVQKNVKYVAFEDGMEGFIPRDASLVCSRRFGDCKDMASILTKMLTMANVPAYFTWIGTRHLPYKFSEVPLPLVSNHMICTVKLNDKFVFLDGTDPTCVFGMPSSGIQDKEAMLSINDHDYQIVKVPTIDKTTNVVNDTTWLELSPDGLKGKIKRNLKGYFASNTHAELMYLNAKNIEENMKDEFSRGSNKFKLDAFKIDDKQSADDISLLADFSLPSYAKQIGTEYFLNLNLFKFYADRQIDYPRRKMPIEFDFKFIRRYVTLLKIPTGYKLTSLPQGKTFHNAIWGFDLKYEQKGNYIVFSQEFDNNTLMLTNNDFEQWNKVLENLYPLYKESLSLTKI